MGTLSRRRLLGAAILGAAALLGGAQLARTDYSRKVSTDVIDLLPAGERTPEVGLLRELASDAEARVMLFVLVGPDGAPAPPGAARRFAAELASRPAFKQALALDDSEPLEALGRSLFERRFTLLFPLWLHDREDAYRATLGSPSGFTAWLADDTERRLGRFLATPGAIAFQDALPADPLLLMAGSVERMETGLALADPAVGSGPHPPSRVWARIAASPLQSDGQGPVFEAIGRALDATRAEFPGVSASYTGVNRFAAASKSRIQKELGWLNALSAAAVLAVVLVLIRGAHRALHLAPPVLIAVLGAWVCTTLAFERVHVLVFVVGSMLTGVAIDYGFYLYMQAPLEPGEDYWAKVRRLRKPLISSCFTTVAGFALLLFSDLPLVRQLGMFVGAGLLCALGGSVVYFSMLRDPFLPSRELPRILGPAVLARRVARRLLIALWAAALPGLLMVRWRDDIRELQIPSPDLQREDARIRALFSGAAEPAVYLTQGSTLAEAREALERFGSWLRESDPGIRFANLGAIVPTEAEHAEALRFLSDHPEFPALLRRSLAAGGFEPGGFDPFFEAYAAHAGHASAVDLGSAVQFLGSSLSGPLSLLLHDGRPLAWYVTLASPAPAVAPPAATQTVSLDQLRSLNLLFGRYRRSAMWLSLTGLAIVGIGVLLSYGIRDGARVFSIPCGVALGLFGLCGWLGMPLNLFHLLGAFLGVCLTHNYSIFTVTSAYLRKPPPASVRLSALCAAVSFGVLSLSAIPVVHALGETVAAMVLAAIIVIEFEHFAPIAGKR
jgi:predicted exporter